MSDPEGREAHLAMCKRNALEYLADGDIQNAIASMLSDLNKHPKTAMNPGSVLSKLGMLAVINHDEEGARRFIEGFN